MLGARRKEEKLEIPMTAIENYDAPESSLICEEQAGYEIQVI
jgi:hypothetical protein